MKRLILRAFFLFCSLEGIFVLVAILRQPSEPTDAVLLGLTPERLLLFIISLGVALVFFGMGIASWVVPSVSDKIQVYLDSQIDSPRRLKLGVALIFVALVAGIEVYQFALVVDDYVYLAYLDRTRPILLWGILILAQSLVALFFYYQGSDWLVHLRKGGFFGIALVFAVLVSIWLWATQGGYGFSQRASTSGIFHSPGTPLLGAQVILALGLVLIYYVVWRSLNLYFPDSRFSRFFQSGFFLGLLLFLITFSLWNAVPLEANWFAEYPRAPNYEFYPNSDAIYYDKFAHRLLIGEGFGAPLMRRPVYVFFLAISHLIGGMGYEETIWLSVLVLSAIPVGVYGLTTALHTRYSGLLAGILIMLRERNALILGDSITVAHAKVFMSDLPAMLGVVLFLCAVVHWLKEPNKRMVYALLAGGVIGFFMLIRSELGVMVPFVGLGGLFLLRRHLIHWVKGFSFILLGMFLVLSPWIWRNWQTLGTPFLDVPGDHIDFIEFSHQDVGGEVAAVPRESKVRQRLMNPEYVAGTHLDRSNSSGFVDSMVNHFVNGAVQSVIYLPMAPRLTLSFADLDQDPTFKEYMRSCCSPEFYIRQLPYWWSDWDGRLASESVLSSILVLFFIAIGLVAVRRRHAAIFLLPILAWAAHLLIYALIRRSGGRFILEVDWIMLMFYGIGLIEFMSYFFGKMSGEEDVGVKKTYELLAETKSIRLGKTYGLMVLGLFVLGASLPLVERVFPQKYDSHWLASRLEILSGSEELGSFMGMCDLEEESLAVGDTLLFGRALYPRFFLAGDGMAGDNGKLKLDYSRIEFYLMGQNYLWVAMPNTGGQDRFPHGSDVVVGRCSDQTIAAIFVLDDDGNMIEFMSREGF